MDLLSGQQRTGQQQPTLKVPTIRLHVPLDQPTVNINFTALAEQKYGWDALHPVAARLRALNRYESDEDSDSEAAAGDVQPVNGVSNGAHPQLGNLHQLATTDGEDSAQPAKTKRKRRRDLEYYDISDPFIDDVELALQELTAASKDGFFVFQGPLVAEGEKVRIEKSDGSAKRGGKGSRGGRSGRGRGGNNTARPLSRPKPTTPNTDLKGDETNEALNVRLKAEINVDSKHQERQARTSSSSTDTDDESRLAPAQTLKIAESSAATVPTAISKAATVPIIDQTTPLANGSQNTPPRETSVNGANPQSPEKKRKLSAAVLARRTEKAAERAAAKAAEKAAVIAQKQASKAAVKLEKEARKAARVVKVKSTVGKGSASTAASTPERELTVSAPVTPAPAGNGKPHSVSTATPAPMTPVAELSMDRNSTPLSPQIQINPDGSSKKIRKPPREKTVEEKAELARRARESRERKKAEKKAAIEAEKAALLRRAIANPNIDTTGLEHALAMESPAPKPPTNVTNGMHQVKQELLVTQSPNFSNEATQVTATEQSADVVMNDTEHPSHSVRPNTFRNPISQADMTLPPSFQPPRTESPSGRSMSVEAVLE